MTAKVLRIPEFREREADASAEAAPEAPGAGWDPYEVWRTRVLQPRLEDARANDHPVERSRTRSLFSWFRRRS